jgi:P-type Cu+ transporter
MAETARISCFHCGEDCGPSPILFDEHNFCCLGCRTVYGILSANDACKYYAYGEHPGIKATQTEIGNRYAFLDNPEIRESLMEFSDGGTGRVKFFIPYIHCSSCIWLLENLGRFNEGVMHSFVNFARKEVTITFREEKITLRQLVELLVSVNYTPDISTESRQLRKSRPVNRALLYRLGVAGFCFGNMMLFSFPSYLAINDAVENLLRHNFGYLNLLFGIPVAFYSGSIYFEGAFKGLRKRYVSIDVPIALGIFVLFARSAYEILSGAGPGFMDSLGGLVFFLLVGRWYQDKTYQALSFERDYRSYFPVAVTTISDDGKEEFIPLKRLRQGMRILVRNQELIPADALLVKGEGQIDYSFVSGESTLIPKKEGDRVYAGGRQSGSSIELIIEKEVSQSRLTELWNQDPGDIAQETPMGTIINKVGQYFTVAILLIALATAAWWWFHNPAITFNAVSAVLIVACPCALALTVPFSFGGVMRVFGRNGFYLKRTYVVEQLSKVDTIVFDKTGTITRNDAWDIDDLKLEATAGERAAIRAVVRHSTHPLSLSVYAFLKDAGDAEALQFTEIAGKGIEGTVNGMVVRVGSSEFVNGSADGDPCDSSRVFVSMDGEPKGFFTVKNLYRDGLKEVISNLSIHYELHLLSGDNDAELPTLLPLFGDASRIRFRQTPQDKLEYIRELKTKGKRVLMIGDGLNDAGALRESDCGISIADDVYHFSPACDAILDADRFHTLDRLIRFSRTGVHIVVASMILSLVYNLFGVSFAMAGFLTPVLSAILMPVSSVTVVGFVTLIVALSARKAGFDRG